MRRRIAANALFFLFCTAGCLGDVDLPPRPPTVLPVESPTSNPNLTIRGNKPKDTAIFESEVEVVPVDELDSWSYPVTLNVGENRFSFTTRSRSGLRSTKATELVVEFEPPCPNAPSVKPIPAFTNQRTLTLEGTKPKRTALLINQSEMVPLGDETAWKQNFELPDMDGAHVLVIVAKDAKGNESDPKRLTVTLDRAPPAIVSRYPPLDDPSVPVPENAQLSIVFDSGLEIPGGEPDSALLTVRAGATPVAGLLTYSPVSHSLHWQPQAPLAGPTTATLDAAFVTDLAGNAAAPTPEDRWTWTFTATGGPDVGLPPVPAVDPLPSSVSTPEVELTGNKPPWTGILVNRERVIAVNDQPRWTYVLPLPAGTSTITLEAESTTGIRSTALTLNVERTETLPPPPSVSENTPTEVTDGFVTLLGTKPANTGVLLEGTPIVCTNADTTWTYAAELTPGINDLKLQTRAEDGSTSEPLIFSVNFDRMYSGLVPQGFKLKVAFGLRDLSQVPGIRSEFETGINKYSVDAWVEGPITPDETCRISTRGERQDIKYVATIEHYIGVKNMHRVPYADEDYRGTDYLASLITAGVFGFRGLTESSQRREPDGRELGGLMSGVTEQELRDNIDCSGSPMVDICTQPTSEAGPKNLIPWTPRRRGSASLLEQGDYLLHILLNLDRSEGWLASNDFETCWGDPRYERTGMHRIVRTISLGGEPYTAQVPQSAELSGPDPEGSGRLFYITEGGVTITWGP